MTEIDMSHRVEFDYEQIREIKKVMNDARCECITEDSRARAQRWYKTLSALTASWPEIDNPVKEEEE